MLKCIIHQHNICSWLSCSDVSTGFYKNNHWNDNFSWLCEHFKHLMIGTVNYLPFSLASLRLFSSKSSLLTARLCCCRNSSYTKVASGTRRECPWRLLKDPLDLRPALSSPYGPDRLSGALCWLRKLWVDFSSSARKVFDSENPLGWMGGYLSRLSLFRDPSSSFSEL